MIARLTIENFKSIKHINIDCRRINIFIGEPNTGKSNMLEAIGLLSAMSFEEESVKNFVRFENLSNLFYDEITDSNIKILPDNNELRIEWRDYSIGVYVHTDKDYNYYYLKKSVSKQGEKLYWQKQHYSEDVENFLRNFKFYKFVHRDVFPEKSSEFLMPPHGSNLVSILTHNRDLREIVNNIFSKYGFKLVVKPRENKLEIQRELEEGVVISFPYSLISDTLQRIVFHLAAMYTNRNSVIAMEEPEAHAFPYYTKYLAERIAMDRNNNQYFITTHNPYFLLSVLEKSPKDDVAVFITYFEDYKTKIKSMSQEEIEEVLNLGIDVFFNIELFMGGND